MPQDVGRSRAEIVRGAAHAAREIWRPEQWKTRWRPDLDSNQAGRPCTALSLPTRHRARAQVYSAAPARHNVIVIIGLTPRWRWRQGREFSSESRHIVMAGACPGHLAKGTHGLAILSETRGASPQMTSQELCMGSATNVMRS